jgi:hypothetical protein
MCPSLALRRACQLSDQDRRGQALGEPILRRDPAASATETVALVLGEDSPLPDTAADVEDRALRLRGHVSQPGTLTPSQEPALLRAQQLCSGGLPDGYMPSRVHLVRLAEATQDLIAAVQAHDVGPCEAGPETALVEAADQSAARRGLRSRPRLRGSGRVGAPDMTAAGAVLTRADSRSHGVVGSSW